MNEQDIRQRFEAWARTQGIDPDRASDGTYFYSRTNFMWNAWHAASSSPTASEKQRDDARAILKNIAKQWPDSFAGESARAHLAKGETK